MFQICFKATKPKYWTGNQKTHLHLTEKYVGRIEKLYASKVASKSTQLQKFYQEELAKMSETYCEKVVKSKPEIYVPSKTTEDYAYQILSICKLLNNWECDEK